jgi:hypothetical protein
MSWLVNRNAKTVVIAVALACAATTSALACAPSHQANVAGPVLDVPEAGVICVALGPRPEQWVRVRVVGAEQLDRKTLMAAAFSKRVECTRTATGAGACRLAGEDLAAIATSPSISRVADTWR